MIDHKVIQPTLVFKALDTIEDKLGLMAHNIPELSDKLKAWQDGKLTSSYFINYLNKYIDNLNN